MLTDDLGRRAFSSNNASGDIEFVSIGPGDILFLFFLVAVIRFVVLVFVGVRGVFLIVLLSQ